MNYLSSSSSSSSSLLLSSSSSSPPPLPLAVLWLLFIMHGFSVSLSSFLIYQNCVEARFECGNISIGYPFFGGDRWPECGHPGLELLCDGHTNRTTIDMVGVKYEVMDIHRVLRTLRLAREDLLLDNGFCRPQTPIKDSIIDSELFELGPPPPPVLSYTNITLSYDCPSSMSSPWNLGNFSCNNDSDYKNVSITMDKFHLDGCSDSVTATVFQSNWTVLKGDPSLLLLLKVAMATGFQVKWKEDTAACRKCNASGGACGFNLSNKQTFCYCPHRNQTLPNECGGLGSKNNTVKLGLGLGIPVAVTIAIVLVICFVARRFKGNSILDHLCQATMEDHSGIEAFIQKFGSLAPRRYFYGEIKKMTNKFNDKLGQGGYGTVYKGMLSDGRLVAVKVLSESKGNGEDFMNEVASISRTSHVNIVTLLGFCIDRSKRALVFEFMPHGSLDKFIYDQALHYQSRCQLEWKTLFDIAIGIARGLEYLHQGCNTRILHFDIKPHNILLDENFSPKISDFGLSKLCERKESVISMTCARGTIGYIAPEMICRTFGGVSYKSDVYSYGMMILEMVGGTKNTDVRVSETSEVYFPSWVYNDLDRSINSDLNDVTIVEEEEIRRKLMIVSLWCIQSYPTDRPSMTKVLEMLQGELQSLVIPPRRIESSPIRSPKTYIETSSMS